MSPRDVYKRQVLSSLAFHYLESFAAIVAKVSAMLPHGGDFVFSVEHPVFTAYGTQDWIYDGQGNILHFPVDRYFYEGKREAHLDVYKRQKAASSRASASFSACEKK